MRFESGKMNETPEARLQRRQGLERRRKSFDELAHGYEAPAEKFLAANELVVRDELGRFAEPILKATEGLEATDIASVFLAHFVQGK